MEAKCKNCMCYHPTAWHADGTKGTCDQSGELLVHHREHMCDCGCYKEMSKVEKLKRTINRDLHAWIRERDEMFKRSMELVCHIGQLFEKGEFKVFDVVKSASEMKGLVFFGKDTMTAIDTVWTYHCPWNEEKEHFIVITKSGKLVVNSWDDTNPYIDGDFVFDWLDIEEKFDDCMYVVNRIRKNCVMQALVCDVVSEEVEQNKCVSDVTENPIRYPR